MKEIFDISRWLHGFFWKQYDDTHYIPHAVFDAYLELFNDYFGVFVEVER